MDNIGKQKVEKIIAHTIDELEFACDKYGIQIFDDELFEIGDEIRYQLTGERMDI